MAPETGPRGSSCRHLPTLVKGPRSRMGLSQRHAERLSDPNRAGLPPHHAAEAIAMGIFADAAVIAYKSPIVIGKRLVKFARGGASGGSEAARAIREKAELAAVSATSLTT